MSSVSSLNFSSAAKVLLANAQPKLGPVSSQDEPQVQSWLTKLSQSQDNVNVEEINKELTPRTYIASNYPTIADVALYTTLHPLIQKNAVDARTHPAVVRYFDHIQSNSLVRQSDPNNDLFPVLDLKLEQVPAPERKVAEPKKKEKKDVKKEESETKGVVEQVKETVVAAAEKVKEAVTAAEPKQKKEKKAKEPAAKKEAVKAEDAGDPKPSMIDLRVGHIVDIMKHPDADGLYVEQIDIGEESGPRTVVSGLVNYIPIEQMRDKYLVAVCNLKPANMRGVKSFAMVLCATSKDGKEDGIELIQPPPGSKPGDRVYFEGSEFESATPISQLNPKKKIFETIQPGFITLDTREAAWVDPTSKTTHKIRTEKGYCLAPTLIGASLS